MGGLTKKLSSTGFHAVRTNPRTAPAQKIAVASRIGRAASRTRVGQVARQNSVQLLDLARLGLIQETVRVPDELFELLHDRMFGIAHPGIGQIGNRLPVKRAALAEDVERHAGQRESPRLLEERL